MELGKNQRSKKLRAFIDLLLLLRSRTYSGLLSRELGVWWSFQHKIMFFHLILVFLPWSFETVENNSQIPQRKDGFLQHCIFFKPNFLRKRGHATTLLLLTQVSPLSTTPWTPRNGTCWPSSPSRTSSLNTSGFQRGRVCSCSVWVFLVGFCLFVCFGFLQRRFWHYFPFIFGVLFVQITVSMREAEVPLIKIRKKNPAHYI